MDWAPGYRERPPPAALRPSVSCVWARVVGPGGTGVVPVLPDACVDLIWQQGVGVFVAGPDTGPAPSVSPPGTVLAGVRLAPGAGGPALGLPLSALLDQRVDAADLGTGPAAGLARLDGALDPAEALLLLAGLAAEMVADGPADPLVTHAVRLLGPPRAGRFHRGQLPGGPARSPVAPAAPVAEAAQAEHVATRLGVSERQLRRRCQAAVGYGPATLRRVLRFRRFVSWADDRTGPPADLATAAAEFGYADQAHLTRESVRLAGLPPTALVQSRRPAAG